MKILKLFPVAFAAFALASCSNDELFSLGAEEQGQKDPNHLYVSVEELKDGEGTRSGFVYNYNALENPNGQYFAFTKDDVVKLYDSENNWRPQYWAFSASATKTSKYAKSTGFSVFTENVTDATEHGVKKVNGAQFTNAYGVLPAGLSVFTNETRTKLKFDFDMLKYYSLDQIAVTDGGYADGKLAKAPIPMWGVANGQEMKVKYLTGILKVDISNVLADADANTHSFLIVQSTDGTNGYKMHPSDLAEVPYNPEPDANGDFKAPEVKTLSTGATATALSALTAVKLDGSDVASDMIIIDLGNVSGRTCIAVPLMAADAAQQVSAYLATNKTAVGTGVTTVDLSGAIQIGTTKTWTVEASNYYRIMDNAVFDVSGVNTLNELAKKIKELDNSTDRDFTMNLADNVNVQGGDDPEGYTLTLLEGLKHNVNLTFGSGFGFKMIGTTSPLVIKTVASDNDKVLTVTNTSDSNIPSIKVDKDAAGKIVLKGILNKVINNADDVLTVADGQGASSVIETSGRMIFDATGKAVSFNILKGCDKVNIVNGSVNNMWFGNAGDANLFAGVVEIHTEGTGFINAVDFNYVKTNGQSVANLDWADGTDIYFTSKLTRSVAGSSYATTFTQIKNGVSAAENQKVIVTAQQLGACTTSDGVVLAKEIDLNNQEWSPLASKVLNGNYAILPKTSTKTAAAKAATIKNLKITAAANAKAGLFGTLTNNVSNLVFEGVAINGDESATGVTAGALAGTITSADITIDNVSLNGVTISLASKNAISASGPAQHIGGLVGSVDNVKVTLKSIKNVGTTTLTGNGSLGGFVGSVLGDTPNGQVFFGAIDGSKKTVGTATVGTVSLNPTDNNGALYDPTYAMVGTYVGYVGGQVGFYYKGLLSAANILTAVSPLAKEAEAKWGVSAFGATSYYDVQRQFNEVGFGGYDFTKTLTDGAFATSTKGQVSVYGYKSGSAFANSTPGSDETKHYASSIKKNAPATAFVTIQYED